MRHHAGPSYTVCVRILLHYTLEHSDKLHVGVIDHVSILLQQRQEFQYRAELNWNRFG